MSAYILMLLLESAPRRYDLGIRLLTWGRVDQAYDRLTAHIEPGQRVLDIGCGTGALTIRAARHGAQVTGIDVNAGMLAVARARAVGEGLADRIAWREMGVAELGGIATHHYDAVMSGLCFSELTEGERTHALREARRVLVPGGLLLLADETVPRQRLRRWLCQALRLPLALVTYLLTQTTTAAVEDLPGRVRAAGYAIQDVRWGGLGDWVEVVAAVPLPATCESGETRGRI